MARRPRMDDQGSWHHIMNRAVARRPLFENRHDVRLFLAHLAQEVRAGNLEVHCWCVMTTHFHLLVRSPVGELGGAIGRATNKYVRRYNRSRKRDGPLVRGRFRSRVVDSERYRHALVRYIDDNPVAAGVRDEPWNYPWGSAATYGHGRIRPWLESSWIEAELDPSLVRSAGWGAAYRSRFPARMRASECRWIDETLAEGRTGPTPHDDLVLQNPKRVLDWMRRKAELADGCEAAFPVADLPSTQAAINDATLDREGPRRRGRPLDLHLVLRVGLGRDLAGAT